MERYCIVSCTNNDEVTEMFELIASHHNDLNDAMDLGVYCNDVPVSPGCDTSSWNENGTCIFIPTVSSASHENNDRIVSSIMSFPGLKNVHMFCDQNTHNSKAPTKQNFLCEGKSISEIINAHPDFKNMPTSREPNVPGPPQFIVKQITTPRFVLLVEETGNMNLRDTWKFLKLAVRKFIKYDLPSGTQIGLISVSTSDVKVLSNMTSLLTINLRRALADKLPNYPNIDSGGSISLRRGIFHAVEMLKQQRAAAAGSVIILVSQGTVSTPDLEVSLDLLRKEEVTLAAIEYPSLGDGKISVLAEGTNGPNFVVRESGVGPTTHMSTFIQLINALMSIQRYFTEDLASSWPVMIHQAEYKGDSRSYVEANFSFESAVSQSPAEFFIYTSNPNDPKINSVELTSPSGLSYTTQLSDLHDINVIKIDALINENIKLFIDAFRLGLNNRESMFVGEKVDISFVVTRTSSEDLSVRLYTNVELDKVANLSAIPLALFVEVKHKKISPVIDADVEATIVAGNKKWTVKLLDNGNGDPDLTGGDGVYSRYFIIPSGGVFGTQLEIFARVIVNPYRARYITVSQPPASSTGGRRLNAGENYDQPCCGSRLVPPNPKQQYEIVTFAERTTNTLMLRFSDNPVPGFYTPGRIGDLRIANLHLASKNLTLTWTAPGEDLDQGVPASYQIFYSVDDKNGENWSMLSEFKADLEAGVEDNATVTMPNYGSFLVAIRAIDFYLRSGKMSNIVKVVVSQPPKEPQHSFSSAGIGSGGGNTLSIKNTTPSPTGEFSKFDLMLIVICGVAFVLLLAGMIVILLYCRRVGTSQRKSSKNPGDTKIAAITDPKSPIHWSASELLGEHEKRHSLYGGSVSPKSEQNLKNHEMQLSHNQINQHHIPNGHPPHHGHNGHPPMHLNIMPSEYGGTNSSTRSRSSPDSYDDPDSPTPIPVSVRHISARPGANNSNDYTICVDNSSRNNDGNSDGSGRNSGSYGYPHHHHLQYPHHQHYQIPIAVGGMSSHPRFPPNTAPSPLPPLPQSASSHLMHYDPDVQGSMSSVNSKKRNITMV
ncbi:Calcium-activated chloride channel regulator 1 [Folsomia candida]|uniref:Calcium-activated chloride channel regulator 1 n=1 Tax=Folsomia candida TaxID=158441 RepID=A0A226EYJ6_FOLCA|nr:Calcium-activated chloride channel regulator 1 [Folsomia candida]